MHVLSVPLSQPPALMPSPLLCASHLNHAPRVSLSVHECCVLLAPNRLLQTGTTQLQQAKKLNPSLSDKFAIFVREQVGPHFDSCLMPGAYGRCHGRMASLLCTWHIVHIQRLKPWPFPYCTVIVLSKQFLHLRLLALLILHRSTSSARSRRALGRAPPTWCLMWSSSATSGGQLARVWLGLRSWCSRIWGSGDLVSNAEF